MLATTDNKTGKGKLSQSLLRYNSAAARECVMRSIPHHVSG
jgi:hypothetical protein